MRIRLLVVTVMLCSVSNVLIAQELPNGFASVTLGGSNPIIPFPTAMAFVPDGRIFVTTQNGYVRIIKDNVVLVDPFYQTIAEMQGERGMSGIAIDPEFTDNHYIYLYYTVPGTPAHNRVVRVTADGDRAVEGSEQIILELDNLGSALIHNAGAMAFGHDGKLYIAVGDNGSGSNAQNLDTYLGKILRINKDGSAPPDNPFPVGSEQRKRVWAYGFRNPFSLGFHSVTGQIFANDVGQSTVEEINDVTLPGLNFGWPATEGPTSEPEYQTPLYSYVHTATATPSGCAIVGGDFVPPNSNYPIEYVGKYFFNDYCQAWMYMIDPSESNPVAVKFGDFDRLNLNIVGGPDGNIYFLNRGHNVVYKLVYSDSGFPVVTSNPRSQKAINGQPVSLVASAAGQAPITFQWVKDGIDIPDATGNTYTISSVQFSDAGSYTVKISNAVGSVVADAAQLAVTANNRPVVTIKAPSGVGKFLGGSSIDFSAVASDAEDGALPESAFQWYIDFHHDVHKHDQPPVSGSSGTFHVPDRGETSSNVWYRFIVQVTDIGGLTGVDSVDVHPVVSQLTFNTNPPGMQITIDGQPVNTPYTMSGVAGIVREIGVLAPQEFGDTQFDFFSWSIGGDAEQSIVTPNVDLEYVATYTPILGSNDVERMSVYPSLTRGDVFVPWNPGDDIPEIRVTDMYGRNYDTPVSRTSNELIVSLQNLAPAMYILQCRGTAKRFTAKIAVVR